MRTESYYSNGKVETAIDLVGMGYPDDVSVARSELFKGVGFEGEGRPFYVRHPHNHYKMDVIEVDVDHFNAKTIHTESGKTLDKRREADHVRNTVGRYWGMLDQQSPSSNVDDIPTGYRIGKGPLNLVWTQIRKYQGRVEF